MGGGLREGWWSAPPIVETWYKKLMQKLDAQAFFQAAAILQRLETAIRAVQDRTNFDETKTISRSFRADLLKQIDRLQDSFSILGANVTAMAAHRLTAELEKQTTTFKKFIAGLTEINGRLNDELGLHNCVSA